MIFLVQFGINKHLQILQRPQSALALRARALLLVFEKDSRAYLFQIALEIMWLPVQIALIQYSGRFKHAWAFSETAKKISQITYITASRLQAVECLNEH